MKWAKRTASREPYWSNTFLWFPRLCSDGYYRWLEWRWCYYEAHYYADCGSFSGMHITRDSPSPTPK